MNTEGKKDLKWLSDLSGGLVRELEDEERRATKARELHARMRAAALQIATEAAADSTDKPSEIAASDVPALAVPTQEASPRQGAAGVSGDMATPGAGSRVLEALSGFPDSVGHNDLLGLNASDQQRSSSGIVGELTNAIQRVRENVWVLVAALNPANSIPTQTAPHFSTISTGESAPKVAEVNLLAFFAEDVLERALSWAEKPYRIGLMWSSFPEQKQIGVVATIPRARPSGTPPNVGKEIVVRIKVGAKEGGCRLRAAQSSMPILFTGIDLDANPEVYLKISG